MIHELPFKPPLDWPALLGFLAARAIPGVESVTADAYRRTIRLEGGGAGLVEAWQPADDAPRLLARIPAPASAAAPGRLRRLFDLDADPDAIASRLARDPLLRPRVEARPGLRVPGAWDPFELAVRAILGQQVSVGGATTLAGRLVLRHGEERPGAAAEPGLSRLFPRPDALAGADLRDIGLPAARARAIAALAAAVSADPALLAPGDHPGQDLEATCRRLQALPGIGPWTAHYVAMRALREPDAFPASDLGLLRAAAGPDGARPSPAALQERAEAWRPWRAYAALHLWTSAPGGG